MEQILEQYNKLGEVLQIIPSQAKNANGVDFSLAVNIHATKPEQMVSSNIQKIKVSFLFFFFFISKSQLK